MVLGGTLCNVGDKLGRYEESRQEKSQALVDWASLER
jgi:hypothetical protein